MGKALVCGVCAALAGCGLDGTGLLDTSDGEAPEAEVADAVADGGAPEAASSGGHDSGAGDATVTDAHGLDAGTPDTGVVDSGGKDAVVPLPTTYPKTCAEAGVTQGTVTLYVGGDPSKPWTANCTGGHEYLVLGGPKNDSSYPTGGCASDSSGQTAGVVTLWTMVRLDPMTLVVDTSDFTGATSSGGTHEVSGNGTVIYDYRHMPFGAARSCVDRAPQTAGASIDLSSTHFAVASSQVWYVQGFSANQQNNMPFGGATPGSGKTIALSVGGYPGGVSPCNDYAQTTGGACLQLVYAP